MRKRGFTLIELMIVMVIMAILASASVAGYRQYLRRANRADATAALLRLSAAEERFYLQNNRYATTADELADPPPAGLGIGGTERGFYDLSVAAAADGAVVGYILLRANLNPPGGRLISLEVVRTVLVATAALTSGGF